MPTNVMQRTTPNILRSQARKAERRRERRAALEAEAKALGIAVQELQERKFIEVQRLIREQAQAQQRLSEEQARWRTRIGSRV